MMKKILVMPDGNFLAHTSRPLEIAKNLREHGYEVMFAGEGQYMSLPKKAGFQIIEIKTIDPEIVMKCARKSRCNFYNYSLLKDLVESELQLFERVKPDMVLGDFRVTLSTSCELAEIPFVIVLNAVWTNYYSAKDIAPEHLSATRFLGTRITTEIMPWIKKLILANDCRPFHKYRKDIGLKTKKNFWDYIKGDLTLIADIPEYGPTINLPDNFKYIGPIMWEPDIESSDWLVNLDPDRPTIYITMGSTGYPRFFEQAVEIFGNSKYQCIMTTGGMIEFSDIPNNFYITDYAAGSDIMKRSDVVVSHGGNGTIYQALAHGVPMIGIPTWADQEYNLQRVEDMGVGIQLSEIRFKPEHLRTAVEKILTQSTFRNKALQYKNIIDGYRGPETAVQLISSFLSNTLPLGNVKN